MGRTQLQDAVPMRLGQSFGAFAHVLKRDIKRLKNVMDEMKVLNIGATAIGTAINVDPYYLANISYELSKVAGILLKQADDLIDATQNLDGFVSVSRVTTAYFYAMGKNLWAYVLIYGEPLTLCVLLLILPNAMGSVDGTWISVPLSQIIAMLISVLLIRKNRIHEQQFADTDVLPQE